MNLLSILLQVTTDSIANPAAAAAASPAAAAVHSQNYFELLLKGGWVLLPLSILLIISNYVIIERWVAINILGKLDPLWTARVNEFVAEGKIDKAIKFCNEKPTVYAKVLSAGLEASYGEDNEIQDALQAESRQQITELEKTMNYLGISASIAPMMGFLGTILGVIKIFYNISITNDLNIANISDGLYQKMICSGAGLFVGIIAYTGFYILNGRIDKVVSRIDKASNDLLKEIRNYKRGQNA